MTKTEPSLIVDMLREGMAKGETPFLTISSDSMAPLLKTGDQVGLESVEPSHLQPGDIITINQGAYLLTHRFWQVEDEQLRTRGDRPIRFDPLWPSDCLLGRVSVRKRNGRTLSFTSGRGQWLNRHLGHLIMAESLFLNTKWLIRLIHRANFVWASFIVIIIK